MAPEQWLELVKRYALTPEEVSVEEVATLRSNYVVWNAALEVFRSDLKHLLSRRAVQIFHAKRFTTEEWHEIRKGNLIDGVTQEQVDAYKAARDEYQQLFNLWSDMHTRMKFFQKFDEEFQTVNGQLPHEVQESIWKARVERLEGAIFEHRRAHVVANKAPNGLDFALWAEVDLGEFHPSRHLGMTLNGHIGAMKE